MAVQIAPTLKFNQSYLQTKRVLDVLFTLLVLIPLCIIIAIIAVMIRLDSPGPIIFRQERVGLNGVKFYILKFRSMYVNSDESTHREATTKYISGHKLSGDSTPDLSYKHVDDPRITKIGRFLRKTSIDELPQFFNVLRGEMTLVGPRPPVPYEVERYSSYDRLRLCGKPGLTGPWQIYGRSRVPFRNMVEMDIAYLQRQSLIEDLKLIVLTVPVMIHGRGGA